MNKLAVFDCDGTLVDSGAPIYAALKATLEQNGLPVPPPGVSRRVIGLSLTEAMAALLPDEPPERHLRLADDYRRAFGSLRAAGDVEEPLFDGVLELLDALEVEGWLLAVATGKSDRGLGTASTSTESTLVSCHSRPPTVIPPSRTRRWSSRRSPMQAARRRSPW